MANLYPHLKFQYRLVFIVLFVFTTVLYFVYNPSSLSEKNFKTVAQSRYDQSLLNKIVEINNRSSLINAESFGPLTNDDLVIVVQVHNRISYLKHLIDSLSKVKNIGSALLVFSHDVYDPEMNSLVQNIHFAKVYYGLFQRISL